MNKILCFDVSNNNCSVAISKGKHILAFEQEEARYMQAEKLLILIESCLKKAKLEYSDIKYLGVTIGPGSFTGIRIGLSAAEGILYASNMQAIGVTNFEIVFYKLKMQVKKFDSALVILNAYRNQLYIQEFSFSGESKKAEIIDIDNIENYFASKSGKVICGGNGISTIYDIIKNYKNIIILPRFARMRAIHLARYINDQIKLKRINDNLKPLYIRPPDASPPK